MAESHDVAIGCAGGVAVDRRLTGASVAGLGKDVMVSTNTISMIIIIRIVRGCGEYIEQSILGAWIYSGRENGP